MPTPREKPTWPENFWPSISRDTATRRLFPDLRNAEVDFSTMLPGRNWEAWTLPRKHTDFDRKVQELINSSKYKNDFDRIKLARAGILCPYYAWRIFAVLSVENSRRCCANLSNSKIDELLEEARFWNDKAESAKYIIKNFTHIDEISGSVYLRASDFDNTSNVDLISERRQLLLDTYNNIEKYESVAHKINLHIDKITEIRMTPQGRATVDLWQMSFFNKMAALFNSKISKDIDTSGSSFKGIISEATSCISGNKHKITEWGVYKRSEDKMKLLQDNEGMGIGATGFFSMEEENTFASRGAEMRRLIDICYDQDVSISDNTIINSVLDMRDHAGGRLAFLVRDVVLRNLIAEMNIIDDRTFVQLGWQTKINRSEIERYILYCAAESLKDSPNIAAAVVIEALYTFDDDSRRFIKSMKHNSRTAPFYGIGLDIINGEFSKISAKYETYPEETGDFRAFRVAMELLDKCCALPEKETV